MEYGFLAILPPLLAIVLALITKQTILSLTVGIWFGVTIINSWNPILALPKMITDYFIPQIANEWNASMLMLIVSCGGFVYLMKICGGAKAFGDAAVKKIRTRKGAQLATYICAFAFVYTEPTLTLGSIMRPVTEKFNVSRVKLAYICDVMGCPFATLSPITSYGAYATGLIATQFAVIGVSDNPWETFIKTIPLNLYAIFGMITLLYVILRNVDIGPMFEAEHRAITTGQLIGENDNPMGKYDLDEEKIFKNARLTIANFLVPIITLIITIFSVILWSGDVSKNGVGGAFLNGNNTLGITLGFFLASVAAAIMGVKSGIIKAGDIFSEWTKGVELNSQIPIILVLAWSMSAVTSSMDLKGYLVQLVEKSTIAPGLTPMLIFIVGAFVAFSTGSSWGVWSILMPIAIPMAHAFDIPYALMIGAALSGGVFGDHCSPISDTTILASTAAGADHVEHVRTQLPYSLVVAFCSAVGFAVGGLVNPYLGLAATAVLNVILLQALNRIAKRKYLQHSQV